MQQVVEFQEMFTTVPQITVSTTEALPENALMMVNSNGTYSLAGATLADGARIAGTSVKQVFAAGDCTMQLLNAGHPVKLISTNAITDCTVPLKAAAGGKVAQSGTGSLIGMPLHTCAAGEFVTARILRAIVLA